LKRILAGILALAALAAPGSSRAATPKDYAYVFVQGRIADPYEKNALAGATVRLTDGKPEMTIEHNLKNTGRQPIRTNVYDHNFLVLDKAAPSPDFVISLPFQIKSSRPPAAGTAEIRGKQIAYMKTLENQERVFFPI
jgi:hypothetical protein